MFRRFITHPLILITTLGLFFRLCQLANLPGGFHVDEVKIGWNAYSLWKTGADDWLHPFPLHYDTFGDQRPTGIFYATAPSLAAFGLTQYAVRFPAAIFGSLTVIGVFFLSYFLTKNRLLSLFSALALALSPWHITLSRASSEGIIATTLIIFGLVFLIKSFSSFPRNFATLLLATILLTLSFFFYHTARMLVPLFVLTAIVHHFYVTKKIIISSFSVLIIVSLLTLSFILTPAARGRLSQVSIFTDAGVRKELDRLPFEEGNNKVFLARALHNKVVLYSSRFLNEYTRYFSGSFFLNFEEAKPARYQTVMRGLLLYTEFFLLVIGLIALAQRPQKFSLLPLALLLVAPLPAAITTEDAPNLHRSLLMSPFLSMLVGLGIYWLKRFTRLPLIFLALILILDLFHYTHMYMVHNPVRDELTITRNSGAIELFSTLKGLEDKYTGIYITNRPDHTYPWYAFLTRQNPKTFNMELASSKSQVFMYGKYIFTQFRCPAQELIDRRIKNAIAVDAEGCPTHDNMEVVSEVRRISGGIPYTIWASRD